MLVIGTEAPIRAGGAHTRMRVDGHPVLTELLVPNTGLKGWDGHHLWMMGHQVERMPGEGIPWWGFELVEGLVSGFLFVELREMVAIRPTSALVTVLRWSPGERIRTSIEERGGRWTARDLKLAGAALPRVRGIAHATGRPPGGEFPDEATFRARIEPVVRQLRVNGGLVRRADVAGVLERDEHDLRRLCRRLSGLDWPAFVATVKQ